MATFRNGLDTWLKQECATKADNLTVIFRLASSAATAAYRGDKALADNQIEAILARVETDLPRNPKKEPEIEQLGEWITDAYHGKEVVSNMEKFAQMMHKLAFEKVIECQCGKQTDHKSIRLNFDSRQQALAVLNSTLENMTMEQQDEAIRAAKEYLSTHTV